MQSRADVSDRTGMGELALSEMVSSTATCEAFDPGPDPTWDPEEIPPDDNPEVKDVRVG